MQPEWPVRGCCDIEAKVTELNLGVITEVTGIHGEGDGTITCLTCGSTEESCQE